MSKNMASPLSLKVSLVWILALAGMSFAQTSNLEGVWGAKRHFGPEVKGNLEIVRDSHGCRAIIAQYDLAKYDLACTDAGGRIGFTLPDGEGSFSGRAQENGAVIRGYWIQPPTVNDGTKFATPVTLDSRGKNDWQGTVNPLPDEFTLYLVISRKPDGTLGGFLRNPDRNIGVFWRVDRVEQTGDRIKLVGKPKGTAAAPVYGEGVYHPDDRRISIYFPDRGGTYDFSPVSDESSFYARGRNPPRYEYHAPMAEDDAWPVGTLQDVGMKPDSIAELVNTIENLSVRSVHDPYIHGFLVARHGKLVAEEYFYGFNRLKPHDTRSASKSVTATLFGAIMEAGAKVTPATKVYDLLYHGKLPENIDPLKKEMTVEHLLTMSSAYDCDDSDSSRPGSEDTLLDRQTNPDYYSYTLQLPLEKGLRPGQQAVYCSINPNLVGDVISTAAGKPLLDLYSDLLAEPLQLKDYHLNLQPTGEPYMGGGTKWLPRDFMKFGQLMLNGGTWNGKRILSKEYATRASSQLMNMRSAYFSPGYGYLWWIADFPYHGRRVKGFFASGNGGNYVVVFPELDMVVAFYAGNYADHDVQVILRDYIPNFILPALVDESS